MSQPIREGRPDQPEWPALGEPDPDRHQTSTQPADRTEPRRVFLSHTAELRDLPLPRSFVTSVATAIARAGDVLVDTASVTADPHPPAHLDRDTVAGADVYLLLAGFHYGTTVRDRPELSYPEHQFGVAGELGLPRLVFSLSDRVQGPAGLFVDARYGARQVGFRQRLRDSGAVTADVHSPDHAATTVYDALRTLPRARSGQVPPGRVRYLPARPAGFAGRDRQIAAVRATLAGGQRTLTLHGVGGTGTTGIAVEYAYRHADDYDVVWWIPAEQPDLVPDRLAALAHALRLTKPTDHPSAAVAKLLGELRGQDRWLLVFDNVVHPGALAPFLPGGQGHVLITSGEPRRGSMEIGAFTRRESVELLRSRVATMTADEAERTADALGDLPLAVDQTAALLATTGWTVTAYLGLLRESARRLRSRHGPAAGQPVSVAAAWHVLFDHLAGIEPAAAQLVTLAAWLAPEPVPLSMVTDHPEALPAPLATAAADPLEWARVLGVLRQRAVARIGADTLLLHRIPAALLRAHSPAGPPDQGWAAQAVALVRAAAPDDGPGWTVGQALLPHVLAVTDATRDTATVADDVDALLEGLAGHLHTRGEPHVARGYFERCHQRYRTRLGEDHPSTLAAANNLAVVLRELGDLDRADRLDQDILNRLGQILGHDDAGPVSIDLSTPAERPARRPSPAPTAATTIDERARAEREQARKQCGEILERRRRILGPNHPDTINCAERLAEILRSLGEDDQARELARWVAESRATRS